MATASAHADTEITQENSTWPYEHETREERDTRMAWWREARFGMFIHWGVYAVPAGIHDGEKINGYGEWIMSKGRIPVDRYREYAAEFNPVKYDPDAWVRLAKKAGMKYIVITAKHHDGFALYDSRVSEWDIADATPYKKDLLKPLAEACRKHGIKLGFYYSHALDFTHTGGAGNHWDPSQHGDMKTYLRNVAANQVAELLTAYDDLAIWWWDMPVNMDKEKADMLQPLLRLRPGIIVNNRLGGGYRGDTDTPEQNIPGTGYRDRDWKLIKYDVLDGTVRETQLFNLAQNPDELLKEHHAPSVASLTGNRPQPHQVDLAEDPRYAAKREEMEALLLSEQKRHHDPFRFWDQPQD